MTKLRKAFSGSIHAGLATLSGCYLSDIVDIITASKVAETAVITAAITLVVRLVANTAD